MTPVVQTQIKSFFNDLTTKLIISEKLDEDFLIEKGYGTKEQIELLKETNKINETIIFDFDLKPEATSETSAYLAAQAEKTVATAQVVN